MELTPTNKPLSFPWKLEFQQLEPGEERYETACCLVNAFRLSLSIPLEREAKKLISHLDLQERIPQGVRCTTVDQTEWGFLAAQDGHWTILAMTSYCAKSNELLGVLLFKDNVWAGMLTVGVAEVPDACCFESYKLRKSRNYEGLAYVMNMTHHLLMRGDQLHPYLLLLKSKTSFLELVVQGMDAYKALRSPDAVCAGA